MVMTATGFYGPHRVVAASMPRTLYEVLEVTRWAAPTEIKRHYRRLAKRYHPDVNRTREGSERFLEIQAAYQVLSNPLLRREYDEKLEPKAQFHWEPPVVYDGPSHKVRIARGFVDISGPFPRRPMRSEVKESKRIAERRRFARRVWSGYVLVVFIMVAGLFTFAAALAASGQGFQAAVTASGGGMLLGLLFIAWVAKGIGNPEL